MRKMLISLSIVLVMLVVFMRIVSWRNGFVLLSPEEVAPGIFSVASPLIIGLLIMTAVLFLILMVVEKR